MKSDLLAKEKYVRSKWSKEEKKNATIYLSQLILQLLNFKANKTCNMEDRIMSSGPQNGTNNIQKDPNKHKRVYLKTETSQS